MIRNPAVIFDNGSGLFKAGIGDDDSPRVVFPTVVGKPKQDSLMVGMDQKDFYVGKEALEKKNLLDLNYPINNGIIQNWEEMNQIWSHVYENELVVDPSEHPILLTEPPLNHKENREKIMEIFFEKYQVEHFYLAVQAVLALYASGKTTGLLIDSGHGITHTVPIYEGFTLPFATSKINIAGKDLTLYLMKLLREEKKIHLDMKNDFEFVESIKEKYCFIAQDYDAVYKDYQDSNNKDKKLTLPDGSDLVLGNQLFRCPETILQPNKIGKDDNGLHEAAYQSIIKCESQIRKDLYGNIIFSGGTTMFNGISKRVSKEISALAPSTMFIKVKAPQERKHSVWIGGSILSTLDCFRQIWITAKEYKERGSSNIVHKKCF